MFIHNIDPVLLRLGPLEIRYYGLFFILGFVITYFMLNYLAKRKQLELSKDDVADFLMYIILGIIIGARFFYVFIYNLPFYLNNPSEILAIWHGGLSFHGGLVGAILMGLYYCKKKKINFYTLADLTIIPLALGLALGRLGNFTNGELYGRITEVPWSMKFDGAEGYRHPSQLYESFKNLIIFSVLWFIKDKKFPPGFMFWLFVCLYSALRFSIEFFRQPDAQLGFIIGFLTMGQILSIIMLTIGAIMLYKVKNK
jgi:phosphatidylglycerol:prolipoprotein diacylglycerol transferase